MVTSGLSACRDRTELAEVNMSGGFSTLLSCVPLCVQGFNRDQLIVRFVDRLCGSLRALDRVRYLAERNFFDKNIYLLAP